MLAVELTCLFALTLAEKLKEPGCRVVANGLAAAEEEEDDGGCLFSLLAGLTVAFGLGGRLWTLLERSGARLAPPLC